MASNQQSPKPKVQATIRLTTEESRMLAHLRSGTKDIHPPSRIGDNLVDFGLVTIEPVEDKSGDYADKVSNLWNLAKGAVEVRDHQYVTEVMDKLNDMHYEMHHQPDGRYVLTELGRQVANDIKFRAG